MAEDVEMTPVTAAEPPKVNPLAPATAPKLKPGLKLPPQSGLKPGLKLPPKPGATVSALRPGLKLPTQNALKPGIKLPPKPVIRKPGATVATAALPKPVVPAAPAAAAAPAVSELPKPMEQLKSVTQKLKGITQEIPQQAILHKTGIIAEGELTDAQKEAAKNRTARISLSDAMGVAPVKEEAAPMKTIRIKRPVNIPGATSTLTPPAASASAPADASAAPATAPAATGATPAPAASAPAAAAKPAPGATITQRKTLKIARPGGAAVRPGGKFGVKRPSQATTIAKPAPGASGAPAGNAAAPAADAVADIPDIPANVPALPTPAAAPVAESPSWVCTLSAIVQFAACVAIGALVWFFYENSQLPTFCGGLGWGQ